MVIRAFNTQKSAERNSIWPIPNYRRQPLVNRMMVFLCSDDADHEWCHALIIWIGAQQVISVLCR
jgi:hypothetical protein